MDIPGSTTKKMPSIVKDASRNNTKHLSVKFGQRKILNLGCLAKLLKQKGGHPNFERTYSFKGCFLKKTNIQIEGATIP